MDIQNGLIGSLIHNPISYIKSKYNSDPIAFTVLTSGFVCTHHIHCWMRKNVKTTSASLHSSNVKRIYKVECTLFIFFVQFCIFMSYTVAHIQRKRMEVQYIHVILFGSHLLVGYAPEPLFVNYTMCKEVWSKRDLKKKIEKCNPVNQLSFKIEPVCGIPQILKWVLWVV